ncbi:MAG: hypothetical protein R3B67_04655 [Phycisphaerales bacterium]
MQQNLIEPSLPPLPQPSAFEHWILEQQLWPAIALTVLGIIAINVLRSIPSAAKHRFTVAGVLVLLAVGVFITGASVVTQRELLQDRSRQLVQSVADRDPQALRAMLDDRCVLQSRFGSATSADRIVELAITRNPGVVASAEVGKVNAGLYGPQVAATQIRVRTEGSMLPSLSWWRVEWQRADADNADWLVSHIEPIWVQGINNPSGSN